MAITVSQNQKVYDFDSVGVLESSQSVFTVDAEDLTPIGIRTPLAFDESSEDFFVMRRELKDQIRDNFRNLLQTNHGERLMLPDFGANIFPLAWELQSEGGITAALSRIKTAVEKFMPFIILKTFEPITLKNEDQSVEKVGCRISYSVPSINVDNQVIELTILAVA